MAVLLKTASVRVSSIQIMQVRVENKGKSVWKSRYVGDVSVSGPFLLRRDRHLGFAVYKGNMNTQSLYVDANNSYGVTRSFNEYTLSANPSFFNHATNYVQGPIQSNLYTSTSYDISNMHHMYPNSHASSTQQIHMLMSNMMSSINQFETPQVRIFQMPCKKVFHPFIHWQVMCNIVIQPCR